MKPKLLNTLIALLVFLMGLYAYTDTLAPTLLDGDRALYQFTPYILGITYPTGFPIYVLLGKLWLMIVPVGSVAWRMNLLSAICASLTLPIFYGTARRLWGQRLPALVSTAVLGTLPTFWLWAAQAKTYTPSLLAFTIVLWLLTLRSDRCLQINNQPPFKWIVGRWLDRNRLNLAALMMGIQVGIHNTAVLLMPGLFMLFWQVFRFEQQSKNQSCFRPKRHGWLHYCLLFLLPISSYLYVPLRAEWLLAQFGRERAIAHGLVADFYQSGWQGWLRYFTAADFTGGVVTNWTAVPSQFITVYLPFLQADFTWLGVVLGGFGLLLLAWYRRCYFWPLILMYLVPIPFVLAYGQGEQQAFLLTSNLVFALFTGGFISGLSRGLTALLKPPINQQARWVTQAMLLMVLLGLIWLWPWQQAKANEDWIGHKWDTASFDYWADVLRHPLEPEAGIMATWGDLTSMWYMQQVEGLRSDLFGLYPPVPAQAKQWLEQGKALYVAGPTIDAWDPAELRQYHLVPWGRLVRLTPKSLDMDSLLPALSQTREAIFANRLQLSSMDYNETVVTGQPIYTYLAWRTLAELPRKTRYSLRLVRDGGVVAQKDDAVRSGWLPTETIAPNQILLGAYPLDVPIGTWPGEYRLQLAIYNRIGDEWLLTDGQGVLDLGSVTVVATLAKGKLGWRRFNGEIALDEVTLSVSRVTQGKGFSLALLWQPMQQPTENYTLAVALVDETGQVWREWQVPTETAQWQPNQQIKQQIDITIPAETPSGETGLRLRLSWQRADGSQLSTTRGPIPFGNYVEFDGPTIVEKPNRLWNRPEMDYTLNVNFADKARLIGYDLPAQLHLEPSEVGVIVLTRYWQGLGDMRDVYASFSHVVDEQGVIVAQMDGIHSQGKNPTTSWAMGEYIIDLVEIGLPPNLPPGMYTIVTGIYLPSTGVRLPVVDDQGEIVSDSVTLGQIQIEVGE